MSFVSIKSTFFDSVLVDFVMFGGGILIPGFVFFSSINSVNGVDGNRVRDGDGHGGGDFIILSSLGVSDYIFFGDHSFGEIFGFEEQTFFEVFGDSFVKMVKIFGNE